jgi:sporulation protein YlmC with PRC-barrel domain
MKKVSLLLSLLLVFAFLLSACAPATQEVAQPTPGLTSEVTEGPVVGETEVMTEAPTEVMTEAPTVAVTEEATAVMTEEGELTEEPATEEPGAGLLDTNPTYASDLVGLGVRDSAGEGVGEIEQLIVDRNTGQIHYVIIGVGGFLDIGDVEILVPWGALNVNASATEVDQLVTTSVERQVVENAPAFDPEAIPDVQAQDWDADIRAYWQDQGDFLPVTGEGAPVADLFRISDPTEITLENFNGEDIGTVENLVLDLEGGRISHVIWAAGGVLEVADCLLAVPYEQFLIATSGPAGEGEAAATEEPTAAVEATPAATAVAGTPEAAGTPAAGEGEGIPEADVFVLRIDTTGFDFTTAPCVATIDEFPDPRTDPNWDAPFVEFWAGGGATGTEEPVEGTATTTP